MNEIAQVHFCDITVEGARGPVIGCIQRRKLETALAPAYLEEWVRFAGESYVELDGDTGLFEGVSVLSTPVTPRGSSCSAAT